MQRPAIRFDVLALRSAKSRNAYGAALLAVGVALTCTYLSVAVTERSQLFLLLAAVVVGAWYGGLGPGLAATAVSIVGHLAFVKAPYGDDLVRLLIFVLVAVAISLLAAGRRRAEDHALAQQEEMAVTLASIGDAVVVTDRAERITFMNAAAEHLTGWPAAEARGRALATVFGLVDEETRSPAESPAARALREHRAAALPAGVLLVRRGGDEHTIAGGADPIRDRAGQTVGVVLVFRDLTERRAIERDQADVLARERAARRDAAALSAVGEALVQSLDAESVGRHIAEATRGLLGGTLVRAVGARSRDASARGGRDLGRGRPVSSGDPDPTRPDARRLRGDRGPPGLDARCPERSPSHLRPPRRARWSRSRATARCWRCR